MSSKLDDKTEPQRLNMVAPPSWFERIDDWRAKQRPVPSVSEAIRRLADLALDSQGIKRKRTVA